MNATINQQLVSVHQSQLLAEAAEARLAASVRRTTGQVGRITGTWRRVAAVGALRRAAAH